MHTPPGIRYAELLLCAGNSGTCCGRIGKSVSAGEPAAKISSCIARTPDTIQLRRPARLLHTFRGKKPLPRSVYLGSGCPAGSQPDGL